MKHHSENTRARSLTINARDLVQKVELAYSGFVRMGTSNVMSIPLGMLFYKWPSARLCGKMGLIKDLMWPIHSVVVVVLLQQSIGFP